jgi:DNA-binding NarL/FixJ family response regulator
MNTDRPMNGMDKQAAPKNHTGPVKLLIVDDHSAVREGLKIVFTGTDSEVVAEAATVTAGVRLAAEQAPDVVLMDVELTDGTGFDVLERLRQDRAGLPVLMFSLHNRPRYIQRSRSLGANGYLIKGGGAAQLMEAVRRVAGGYSCWPDDAA